MSNLGFKIDRPKISIENTGGFIMGWLIAIVIVAIMIYVVIKKRSELSYEHEIHRQTTKGFAESIELATFATEQELNETLIKAFQGIGMEKQVFTDIKQDMQNHSVGTAITFSGRSGNQGFWAIQVLVEGYAGFKGVIFNVGVNTSFLNEVGIEKDRAAKLAYNNHSFDSQATVSKREMVIRELQRTMPGGLFDPDELERRLNEYPGYLPEAMAHLTDPDMIFVANFGYKVSQDSNHVNADNNQTLRFIERFPYLFWKTDDFSKNLFCNIAISSYIKAFVFKPDLFYKTTGLVDFEDFMRLFDLDIDLTSTSYETNEVDYKKRRETQIQYLSSIEHYPETEAKHSNIPVEQTNWYRIVDILRDRVED